MPKAEKVKADKAPRKPSPYNIYMKEELRRVKEKDPEMKHQEAFKKAASNWATAKENPKNKK